MKTGLTRILAVAALMTTGAVAETAKGENHILVIGDSHCTMTFGKTLDLLLRDQNPGAAISLYGVSSSRPTYFLSRQASHGGFYFKTESGNVSKGGGMKLKRGERLCKKGEAPANSGCKAIEEAIEEAIQVGSEAWTPSFREKLAAKPNFTIVALGSNQLGMPYPKLEIEKMMDRINESGSHCIWVGPPAVREGENGIKKDAVKSYYAALDEVARAKHCQVIDSREFAKYPRKGGDGMHFDSVKADDNGGVSGVELAREWAKKVSSEIQVKMAKATVPTGTVSGEGGGASASGAQHE